MAEAATESADSADDEPASVWANQTPTTRIEGNPRRIIYAGQLGDDVEQNSMQFGIVFEDVTVVNGELWQNEAKPADGTTAEVVDEDETRPTDYRILDSDDQGVSFDKDGNVQTGEGGPNTYEEVEDFDEDEIIVWYNGLSGKRIARILDFNGRPHARWTDDGSYLLKGLFQPHPEWLEDGANRGALAGDDKAPRTVRAPILRSAVNIEYDDEGNLEGVDVDLEDPEDTRILVNISRDGRAYRAHVFDADGFEDEFGSLDAEMPRNDDGYVKNDVESEMEMLYTSAADDVLEAAEYSMHMYTGRNGWQDEPSGWEAQSTSEVGSFGVSAGSSDESADSGDDGGLPAQQQQFVDEVVGELDGIHAEKGNAPTPDDAFDGGVSGLLGKYQDQFSRVPDAETIERAVYEQTGHLSVSELDE